MPAKKTEKQIDETEEQEDEIEEKKQIKGKVDHYGFHYLLTQLEKLNEAVKDLIINQNELIQSVSYLYEIRKEQKTPMESLPPMETELQTATAQPEQKPKSFLDNFRR